jgi:hypothetical protein
MPDIYDIVRAIDQFGMTIYCGISPESWAYHLMLCTRDAGISVVPCMVTFNEWVNRHA